MANHEPGQVITPAGFSDDSTNGIQPTQEISSPEQSQSPQPRFAEELPAAQPQPLDPNPVAEPASQTQPAPVAQSDLAEQNAPQSQSESELAPQPISPYALEENESPQQNIPQNDVISWTASEYISHHKSTGWYIVLGLLTVIIAGLAYWMTGGDIISVVVLILVAIVFGMYAARKPREQEYAVGDTGIAIGPKVYPYAELKSFAILDEGPFSSIVFMPMKRFMPMISIYYDPKDEQQIFNVLAQHLPNEQRKHDRIDRIMKKIRF